MELHFLNDDGRRLFHMQHCALCRASIRARLQYGVMALPIPTGICVVCFRCYCCCYYCIFVYIYIYIYRYIICESSIYIYIHSYIYIHIYVYIYIQYIYICIYLDRYIHNV